MSDFVSFPQSLRNGTTDGTASFPHCGPEGCAGRQNSGGTSPAAYTRRNGRYRSGRPRSFMNLSWTDLSSNVQPSESELLMPLKKPTARGGPVTSANASFDIAYFLKNTGPIQAGAAETGKMERKQLRHKSALRFLKSGRKHSLATKVGTAEGKPRFGREPSPLDYFVPADCVVQKVSSNGKKYLQIIPHQEPAEWMTTSSIRYVSNDCKLPRISTVFQDGDEGVDYDPLDVWIPRLEATKEHRKSHRSASTPELSRDDTDLLSPPSSPNRTERRSRSLSAGVVDLTRNILENQTFEAPGSGATAPEKGLYSHLPITEPISLEEPLCVFGGEVVITELPDIQPQVQEMPQHCEPSYQDDQRGRTMQRSSELLAGQNMRRSSSDYDDSPPSMPTKTATENWVQHQASHEDADHGRNDSAVDKLERFATKEPIKAKPHTLRPTRKTRDERVRARKLRDLESTRQNIDEVIERSFSADTDSAAPSPSPSSPQSARLRPQPLKTVRPRPPSLDVPDPAPTPGFKTGYTPSTAGSMCLSPVMQVAEQIPVKNKKLKKPARLLLNEHAAAAGMTLAVRTHTPPLEQLCRNLEEQGEAADTTAGADDEREGYEDSSVTPTSARPMADFPTTPPMGGPLTRHLSAPDVLSRTGVPPSTSHTRDTDNPHRTDAALPDPRRTALESRVAALERENQLLEAALVAVLKTSGALARESARHERWHGRGRRDNADRGVEGYGRVSRDSAAEGTSPLDVYLETVAAGGRGGV